MVAAEVKLPKPLIISGIEQALNDGSMKIDAILADPNRADSEKRGLLVEQAMRRRNYQTLEDTGEILYFEDGVYRSGGKEKILATLQEIGGFYITNSVRNEVVATIRALTYTAREAFDAKPFILNLQNCLLNFKTGERMEHSPDFLSMVQLPIAYDPKGTCPNIVAFLYDILPDPSDVPLLLEFVAYCFFDNKDLQKELLLVGPPDSGKSKLLDLITTFLGNRNVSNVTMQQLSTNRFAVAQLHSKLANVYADISHARLEDIERFKAIATADEIEAEKKGMQLFKFRPRAKLIYSTNIPPRPPITVDDSYYRRWMLICCALSDKHYFSKRQIVRDPKILARLATPRELAGLFNLVLISARRLLEKQRFCKSPSVDIVREEYDRLSNPVKLWTEECCEEVDDDEEETLVTKEQAHQNYVKFCKARNIAPLNEVWLGKELVGLGYTERRLGKGRDRKRVWNGLKLKVIPGRASFPSLIDKQTYLIEQGKDPLPGTSTEGDRP